ncbi:MAG: hypothetical protein PHI12_08455 [Dehalococcoidales bacterium]|nr:hypothetical protein [Dehalococcoidales bacterium]
MPKEPRSQRLKQKTTEATRPVVTKAPSKYWSEIREVVCPCCGISHGSKYWERAAAYPPQQRFGTIKEASGRGSLAVIGELTPDTEPEVAEIVKQRLLTAIQTFIDKGWMKKEEL